MPSLRHGLQVKDWGIDVSQVTPATLGPALAVFNWVFLDMCDVKSRRFYMAYKACQVGSATVLSLND